jgi:hypothetical protein
MADSVTRIVTCQQRNFSMNLRSACIRAMDYG